METFDLILIGTGPTYPIIEYYLSYNPLAKIALIDKDDPGGINFTRGYTPFSMLLHEVLLLQSGDRRLGNKAHPTDHSSEFNEILSDVRKRIHEKSLLYQNHILKNPKIKYFSQFARFIAPYTLQLESGAITSRFIVLATGSQPAIPLIEGLEKTRYITPDNILALENCPERIVIIGEGGTALEYGFIFASMGSEVTIISRDPRFLPSEEPEISTLALSLLHKGLYIKTSSDIIRVEEVSKNDKIVTCRDLKTHEEEAVECDTILLATGRTPLNYLLDPMKGGIKTDKKGWIEVNPYLESSQKNVWAIGEGVGGSQLGHVSEYEAEVIIRNAIMGDMVRAEYRIVPRALLIDPEIASVGLGEEEAVAQYGEENIRIGFYKYSDTIRGFTNRIKSGFVKVVIEITSERLLGAHIIGPDASLLIQELVTGMHAGPGGIRLIQSSMHIHSTYGEVVKQACLHVYTTKGYAQMLQDKN